MCSSAEALPTPLVAHDFFHYLGDQEMIEINQIMPLAWRDFEGRRDSRFSAPNALLGAAKFTALQLDRGRPTTIGGQFVDECTCNRGGFDWFDELPRAWRRLAEWRVLVTVFVVAIGFALILDQIKRPVMAAFKVE